jgi:hypothetical protein
MSIFNAAGLSALTHGWPGLALAYTSIEAPLLAGLVRGRAQLGKLLLSPLIAAPLTVAAGVGIAAAAPLTRSLGFASQGLMQLSFGVGFSVALGYVSGRVIAKRARSASSHQRGALVEEAETPAMSRRGGRVRGSERNSGRVERGRDGIITLAGKSVSAEDETKHFKIIGTTGTGKSTAIREVLASALRRGDRAVIADPDGGYLERFYDARRGDAILNPFDGASAKWDLYGEIRNAYDVEQLARSLIPDHDGSDRSWRGYARTFFGAVTRRTHEAGVTDVAELYRLLVMASATELKILVAGTPAQPFLDEHNSRMFDSIRSVTSSAVGALEYVAQQKSPLLSVRSWVAPGSMAASTSSGGRPNASERTGDRENDSGSPEPRPRGVLFIPYQAGQIAALRSTISAWMRLAIFEAMNQKEGDQRLWFVVDELDALGQIDGLKDALARLRKFGGRCLLGFQSIAQVSSTYGSGEAQTIVENCGNTLILRCSSSERGGTASFASRLIGQREVVRTTTSRSRRMTQLVPSVTRSEHFNIEPAVMDSEIEQLPDLVGYLKFASKPQWSRVALNPHAAAAERGPDSRIAIETENTRARLGERGAETGSGREDAARNCVQENSPSHEGFEP